MSNPTLSIALLGFPPAERATFETFFRLVSSRRPRPLEISSAANQAQVVICNANDFTQSSAPAIIPGLQVLVTIGGTGAISAWKHLPRPVNLNSVLAVLDAAAAEIRPTESAADTAPSAQAATTPSMILASSSRAQESKGFTPSMPPLGSPIYQPNALVNKVLSAATAHARPAGVSAPQAAPVAMNPAPVASTPPISNNVTSFPRVVRPAQLTPVPASRPAAAKPPVAVASPVPEPAATVASQINILVVDDSDVALKFMHSRLSAFGFSVALCGSGEEALVRVSDGQYQFVFLDVMMAGLDGYQTCKAIKGRKYAGGRSPTVVMLTSRGGTIDKVRGTFAGCDAYLTKPLDESKMLKVLLKYSPELGDSVSTLGPSRASPLPSAHENVPQGTRDPLARAFEGLPNGVVAK